MNVDVDYALKQLRLAKKTLEHPNVCEIATISDSVIRAINALERLAEVSGQKTVTVISLPNLSLIRTDRISWLERPISCSGSMASLAFIVDGKYICRTFDTMDEANSWYSRISSAMLEEAEDSAEPAWPSLSPEGEMNNPRID